MARDVKLSDLRRKRQALKVELDYLDVLIQGLEDFSLDADAPARRKAKRRAARKPRPVESGPQLPLNGNGFHAGGPAAPPTIHDAVAAAVTAHPGIGVSDLIGMVADNIETTAQNPRKLLSTRIAQFVKTGRLVREGNRIFPPKSKN
jgi:hypothetical protein